ncbi:hypothetical protein GCM10023259_101410 [Thermocatellispora tengchongensis]
MHHLTRGEPGVGLHGALGDESQYGRGRPGEQRGHYRRVLLDNVDGRQHQQREHAGEHEQGVGDQAAAECRSAASPRRQIRVAREDDGYYKCHNCGRLLTQAEHDRELSEQAEEHAESGRGNVP